MTQTVPPYAYPQQPPPPRKRRWPWIVFAVCIAVAVIAVTVVVTLAVTGDSGKGSEASEPSGGTDTATVPVEDTAEPEPAPEPEPEPEPFTTDDFKLRVKILSEECYGSAGCNVEFRVIPTYVGAAPDYEERTVEVTYKVTGLEDDLTSTFTLENGEYYEYDLENFGSTSSSSTKLRAKVTSVTE